MIGVHVLPVDPNFDSANMFGYSNLYTSKCVILAAANTNPSSEAPRAFMVSSTGKVVLTSFLAILSPGFFLLNIGLATRYRIGAM